MFIEIVSLKLLQKVSLEIQLLTQDGFGKKEKTRYPLLCIFGTVGIWSIVNMENKDMSNGKKLGLNTILYGPPGTGKTYNTVRYAVSICEPDLDIDNMKYEDVLIRFKELKYDGRIEFTTFHQSYGYEEFIEGIKPIMVSTSDGEYSKDVKYDIIPGIFKEFCTEAAKKKVETKGFDIADDATIWKVTIRSEVRQDCFDNNRVRIDWKFDSDGASRFINDMVAGDIIISTDGNRKRINGIAVITDEKAYELKTEEDKTTRDVKWLAKNIDLDITDINEGKILHRMTVARVPKMKISDIVELAGKVNNNLAGTVIKDNKKPYVFIIDEINRGNISKIFGELITLIEETKRAGADEAMEVTLPYSGDTFSVPKNVYILGTMNTADRSIALMDTALRRRFDFIEMMPDTNVLKNIGADKVDGLDVAAMLDTINERIKFLYDREHTIGHAFFTGLKDNPTVEKLATIFSKSVIPLLQEYFYEDYQKIQFVLGDNGKTNEAYKFIKHTDVVVKNIFKGSVDEVIDLPDKKYEINEEALNNIESYKEIM
jgi:putative mcrBC restriction endonuclease system, mcrB subunit